jgi:hypothetical protein
MVDRRVEALAPARIVRRWQALHGTERRPTAPTPAKKASRAKS